MQDAERKTPRKERRPRTIQACNFCRTKKYKCDGSLPCSNCKRLQKTCAFSSAPDAGSAGTNISISYVKQLERKLEAAEAQLRNYEQQERNSQAASTTATSQANRLTPLPDYVNARQPSNEPAISYSLPSPGGTLEMLSEVMDINTGTKRFEFHGTSSVITALDRLVQLRSDIITKSPTSDITLSARSISSVTEFQNDAFMLKAHKPLLLSISFSDDDYFSLHAPLFIDSYFLGLHYIHPLIDQGFFLKRCHDLWNGETSKLRASFRLQYYAVLALGAASRSWTEGPINGLSQLEWTQLLISRAEQTMTEVEYQADFEGAQAMFILAQVHLHALSYNTAYTYLGNAIRIAHSSAVHRQMRQEDSKVPVDSPTAIISRLWWSIHAQEIELSFVLGRPDGLGDDSFITRQLPPVSQGSEMNFTPALHGISQALREISTKIYHGSDDLTILLPQASTIEQNLDSSFAQAVSYIQGVSESETQGPNTIVPGDTFWVPWQMCMLRIRCLHAKVALYYPFFIHHEQSKQFTSIMPEVPMAASRCVDYSHLLIGEIFRAYKTHVFQRTWTYYSVYLLRALAVVLTNLTRISGTNRQMSRDRDSVIQALHVLDALDSSVVPRRIANFAREYLTLLAQSAMAIPPSPLKDRYQGTPQPWSQVSNYNDRIPPTHIQPIGNFNDPLPSRPSPMPVYHSTAMDSFTMLNDLDLRPAPSFLPSSNMPFHVGPT